MPKSNTATGSRQPRTSNPVRSRTDAPLDALDRRIVAELVRDGRLPNNLLAERLGIAPSTCLTRTRSLIDRGVIRGFRADVDHAKLGADLQALISVRIRANSRGDLPELARRLAREPGVQSVYFITGAFDFLIHVVAADTEGLRVFVADRLSASPEIETTQTSLVFDHLAGQSP
ncbi:MAG: Lrp/AsnC family transcriptional regulator [Candidatus Nanopelagicales bacterium]|jgi:DNA-binding Lrp family transcriptional regulator